MVRAVRILTSAVIGASVLLGVGGVSGAGTAPKPSTEFCTALKSASAEIGKTMPRPGHMFIKHQDLAVIEFAEAKYMTKASKIAPTSEAGVYLKTTARDLTKAAMINKTTGKLSKKQQKAADGFAHSASMDFLKFTSIPAAIHWCGGY